MSNNKENEILSGIIVFLMSPVIIFLMMVNAAYPAMQTWNLWIPDYFGLPELTLPYAVMIILTFSLFRATSTQRVEDNRSKETKNKDIIMMLLAPWIVYLIALVTYKFFII